MSTYSTRQWAYALALIFGACFVICFFWGAVITDPALKALHVDLLRMSFPGFAGLTLAGFVNGLIQSIIWGLVTGWALAASLNFFKK